jgi:glycosyltransferase involved in cell wall biosynthesis
MDREQTPRISVVMPTYNHAAFIRRAVDSLRAQSQPDWELVIVDDGSTDATAAIVEPELADERIRYYRLAENRGLGAALNAGLDCARGELIAYLPADDVYYRDHLALLAACLDEQPAAAMA